VVDVRVRRGLRGGGELDVAGWFVEVEGGEDLALGPSEHRGLGDGALGGGEDDELDAVELVGDVAPRVAGLGLDHTDQQQREPAQLDVGDDPVPQPRFVPVDPPTTPNPPTRCLRTAQGRQDTPGVTDESACHIYVRTSMSAGQFKERRHVAVEQLDYNLATRSKRSEGSGELSVPT
jgi:hypothetical protein